MRVDRCNVFRKTGSWIFILISIIFMGLGSKITFGQYYGMQFKGHEYPLNQRSGLDLTPEGPIDIKGDLDLEFYLRFEPDHESYFGYIFRLLLEDQNIDLIHGIIPENPNNFELIIGDRTSRIAFHVPVDSIQKHWLHLKFSIDLEEGRITSIINGMEMADNLEGSKPKSSMRLMFGAHSIGQYSTTDVPAMVIRDVSLKVNHKLTYHWPLDETHGTVAQSISGHKSGIAVNPDWLLKHHNTWKNLLEMQKGSNVKTAFDPVQESLYIVFEDTIYIYNPVNDSLRSMAHKSPPQFGKSSDIIFDTLTDRLLLYSIDNHFLSSFDDTSGEWSDFNPGSEPLTNYWKHNRFISPDGSLMVFGGYGYHTYKNSVLQWNPELSRFDSVAYNGEFNPRYLAGLGRNPTDGKLYIIGGYGSESGKQSESPDYYYEILSYSLEENSFDRVFEFNHIERGFCFANSVVIDHHDNLYGLYFTKFDFDNTLQLVRIPLADPEIVEVGNPLDFTFIDVNSFTDLFYLRSQNTLLGLITYTTDEGSSVSLHSIAFPPQVFEEKAGTDETRFSFLVVMFLLAIAMMILLTILLFRRKKLKPLIANKQPEYSIEPTHKKRENSILLFGGFQIFDSEGNDITGHFTPLPKKLFLYILLHSLRNGKGVSSQALYETFWFDKSVESARNNRAVNIVKLKSLLENVESTSISKNTGYWKFDFDPSRLHIDYNEFLQITQKSGDLRRKDMEALLAIVEKSPFLYNTNAEWLDSFKLDVSNEIIDTFLKYVTQSSDDPEFLLHLTNCIFVFDMVSEEALKVQCKLLIKQGKHSLAKSAYDKFVNEYKQLYDEEYGLSFNQVIEEQP